MKLKTKKLIAREFLMLLGCIIISLLTFTGILLANYYHKSNADRLSQKISKYQIVKDSLAWPFHHSEDVLTEEWKFYQNLLNDGYTEQNLGSAEEFSRQLSNPANAANIYNVLLKDGYTVDNLGSVDEFVSTFNLKNRRLSAQDSFNYTKSKDLQVKINDLSERQWDNSDRVISSDMQKRIAIYVFVGLIILVFFVRYLFLSVKYSIQILREK